MLMLFSSWTRFVNLVLKDPLDFKDDIILEKKIAFHTYKYKNITD